MSIFRQVAKGVAVSWIGILVSIIASFLMAPFLIHHLGVTGYGVWVLIQSSVSYMYLMDLGLRTAVVRFVGRNYTNLNHSEVSRIISAALWLRLLSAVAVVLITSTIAALLPHLFSIPAQYVMAARVALLLVGISFASTLVFSVFAATLLAVGSFGLLASLELLQTVLTTLGLIPVVRAGYGIVGMAAWTFTAVMAVNVAMTVLCFRVYPQLKLRLTRLPERGLLKSLWSVGLYVLGSNVADQLIVYTDNIVVGAFVSANAVAYYAVAGKMIQYLRSISVAILKYFMPLATVFEARKQFDRLEQLHIKGTQVVMLVTLPIVVTLFMRGGTFLGLWVGADFQRMATPVLKVLMATTALMLTNAGVSGLAIALGKQKWLTLFAILEGLANLTLSIILARTMGLIGVAIGTAVPSVIMQLFVWPRFVCRLLRLSPYRLIYEVWLRPALAVMPFGLVSYWVEVNWRARNLLGFFGQTFVLLPVAAMGAYLVFRKDIPELLKYARRRPESEATLVEQPIAEVSL